MHLGPGQVLIGGKLEFEPPTAFEQVAEEINQIEMRFERRSP